ncbi:MAG: hypothetical protein ABI972_07140 [Acidobacteriota bacterium]
MAFARRAFLLDWYGFARAVREGLSAEVEPLQGHAQMLREFAARGLNGREVRMMLCQTPAYLLGIWF